MLPPPPPLKRNTLIWKFDVKLPGVDSVLFESPRWPSGPLICRVANKSAFKTEKLLKAFADTMPAIVGFKRIWQCESCGCFHFEGKLRQISGATSGTERT